MTAWIDFPSKRWSNLTREEVEALPTMQEVYADICQRSNATYRAEKMADRLRVAYPLGEGEDW